MLDSIKEFRNDYAARYATSVREFLSDHGATLIKYVEVALLNSRSTIYLFGNGGSHAISKCLKYAIENYALLRKLNVRVETGIDVNRITTSDEKSLPGISFIETLKCEGADSRDLVILISGSGDSDNLCEVAEYSKKSSIPTLAIIGSPKGKIRKRVNQQCCFVTPINDQQISEDIIQSLSYGFELDLKNLSEWEHSEKISSVSKQLERAILQIPAEMLDDLSDKIVNSFQGSLPIWVLGLGHSSLSICAEHTAHNLYWDGIFEVDNPPQRFIWSTGTAANLSGISNDRRAHVIPHLMGFQEARSGVVIIYAASYDKTLQTIIKELSNSKIATYLIFTKGVVKNNKQLTSHKTKIFSAQIQAGIAQIFGHILGRIVRMKLLESRNSLKFLANQGVTEFLVNQDLAQRRLLDE